MALNLVWEKQVSQRTKRKVERKNGLAGYKMGLFSSSPKTITKKVKGKKKIKPHKWTKKKDGTYKSNYSVSELNKHHISPPWLI